MSRLFEALSNLKTEQRAMQVPPPPTEAPPAAIPLPPKPEPSQEPKAEHHTLRVVPVTASPLALPAAESAAALPKRSEAAPKPAEPSGSATLLVNPMIESRLVAWTEPQSLGAEKFRALATRFDHLRSQRELRSFQVTSSVIDEGKTLVAGNIAVTLAKYSGYKTLLVEGDLHRPSLAGLFGLGELRGMQHWWTGGTQELGSFVYRLEGMPLWFLPAGKPCEQPSDLLRSDRFKEAFRRLSDQFEWVVVDSTPMLPIVDVNLWSGLLDGTLLVVREGVAPVKALKRGLEALNHPKLIGVVVNEAVEINQASYAGQYYRGANGDKPAKKY
jgi:capsular exopolysaccharide synthesis family protein